MHAGKTGTGGREVGQTQRICEELTRGLRNEGRTLYINNFYTSYPLARFMLQRGEMVAQEESHGILVVKWRDTRDVHVMSTKHGPDMEEVYTSRNMP